MRTLQGHSRAVRALAYAPGPAPLLASAGDDRTVRFWNLPTAEAEPPRTAHPDSLTCLAFSADGTLLASGGRSGSVGVWDVAQRELLHGQISYAGCTVALGFTPDGTSLRLALSSPSSDLTAARVRFLSLQPFAPRLAELPWHGLLESAAFSADGTTVALAGQERSVELWRVGEGRQEPFLRLPGRVRAVALAPGNRFLAAATGRFIELWDLEQRQRHAVCSGHRGTVEAVAFTPDGRSLLSGGLDRSVRRWQVLTGRPVDAWDWQVGKVNALAVSPDGLTAAVGGDRPVVVLWDLDEE